MVPNKKIGPSSTIHILKTKIKVETVYPHLTFRSNTPLARGEATTIVESR